MLVKCVYVTADSTGCLAYYKEKGKIVEEMIPAVKVKQVIDTTGCGDSFAVGVGFGLMENKTDYIKAGRYGNVLGALRIQGKTFDVFKPLDEVRKIMEKSAV